MIQLEKIDFFCKHLMRTLHATLRVYDPDGKRLAFYGGEEKKEPLFCDPQFESELLTLERKSYPVLFSESYPIYYGILMLEQIRIIVGPVNVASAKTLCEGKTVLNWQMLRHGISKEWITPVCPYEDFCNEMLLLYYVGTGVELTYEELNEKNYLTESLQHEIRRSESRLFFSYHEQERSHNPYSREKRIQEGIRKGDVERLIKAYDEFFEGEYGVLAADELRAEKNLSIVGIALAGRSAIEGGIPFERSFYINDNFIRMVDAADNIGEVKVLERQAHIDYAKMVKELNEGKQETNQLIEACKNKIFKQMHSAIRVADLASELGVTQEYLAFLFKKITGKTITDYIMENKIRQAEDMLMYSDYSIGQIASYLGFCSQSHFNKVFKGIDHMTPGEYRKCLKEHKNRKEIYK